MRLFRNLTAFVACLAAALWAVAAAPKEGKAAGNKVKAEKKSTRHAEAKVKEAERKDKDSDEAMSFPVPVGHGSKGLKIPTFSADGLLTMVFNIGHATRLDDTNVQMTDLWVETYDESGAPEMSFTLPSSNLDLTTRILTTREGVTIRRTDFELTGRTMRFDTREKHGTLGGGVKMTIYNLAEEAGGSSPAGGPDAAAGEAVTEPSSTPATSPSTQQKSSRE